MVSLIFLLGISFIATRFFLNRKWPMPWIQTSIMACGLVAIFLVLRIEYSSGFNLLGGQWFASYGNVMINFFNTRQPFVFRAYCRFVSLVAGHQSRPFLSLFQNIYTSFLIQLATLVFLVIIWGFSFKNEPVQTLTSDIGIYVAGFFFFGLVSLAISN